MKVERLPGGPLAMPGDFRASVQDGKLCVPTNVATALDELHIADAETLVAHLHTFPSPIAAKLQWTVPDVNTARARLVQTLRPHLDAELLEATNSYAGPLGALDPRDTKKQR